ncbi:hypothetical protein ACFLRY_04415 [Bacteroidota bacterium]
MIIRNFNTKPFIYLIPLLVLILGILINNFTGLFYPTRIDPEYPYLLNGLNATYPDFSRIGHTDHPGTPFQLLTGIFIKLIYWINGNGNITESVISNPELYLLWSSILITIITAFVVLNLGQVVYKNSGSIFGSLILQSTVLLNIVLIEIFSRYIPDRALIIYTFIFVILCYKYLYQEGFSSRKMALYSGLIMGLGFITKISYLPMLIIPLILINSFKNRILYIVTFIVVSFILLLPVLDRFNDMYQFVLGMATHDGLYGKGNEQIVNINSFLYNLNLIFKYNLSFCIIFLLSFVVFISMLFKSRLRNRSQKEFLMHLAFILATLISVILVAKHFKNYYLTPVFSMAGLMFYMVWKLKPIKRYFNLIFIVLFLVLIALPVYSFIKQIPTGVINKQANIVSIDYVKKHIPTSSYLLIEPSWQSSPFIENGLVYGNSYVRFRYKFYRDYKKVYPNVLTYEGKDFPLKYFRMINVDTEAILKSGQDIFIYATPSNNSSDLIAYLNEQAMRANIALSIDTVFNNDYNEELIISVSNSSNWRIINNQECGFEKHNEYSLLSDDGKNPVYGNYKLDSTELYSGQSSVRLDSNNYFSPKIKLNNIDEGDYIEVEIKIKEGKENDDWFLGVSSEKPYLDDFYYIKRESIGYITDHWQIVRLSFTIPKKPTDGIIDIFFQYEGNNVMHIDDFVVRHFSNR